MDVLSAQLTSKASLYADFYTPPVVSHAILAIQQLAGVKAVPWGGYLQAERQRIIVGQPELVEAIELDPSQVSSEPAIYPSTAAHTFSAWLSSLHCHPDHMCGMQEGGVAALNVKGNFMFESATHRWDCPSHMRSLHLLMHHAIPDRSTASLGIHTSSP